MEIAPSEANLGWSGRLLHNVIPVHYNLTLRPEIDQAEYTGHVDIKLEIKEVTSAITLNADGLKIYNVQLRDDSQEKPIYANIKNVTMNSEYHTATIFFKDSIHINSDISLSMDFNGTVIEDRFVGIFRSSKTNGNMTHSMLTTQFESHYARKAFPCWDEPEFKSTFDVTLEVDKDLIALSNTKIKQNYGIKNNKKHVLFHTTPKMSVYTVAFAVGKFEFIEEECWGYNRSEPVRCRIYTLPGDSQLTHFAMNVTKRSLAYFEKEFQSPYQLNRLDLIAVPEQSSAAMENWGLITFKENLLIFNESIHKETDKRKIVRVIAHELAHQWLGNLVTMKWWSDFWLNEGLARYFELVASDFLYPEYGIFKQFHDFQFIGLMRKDISQNLNPIRLQVLNSPDFSIQDHMVIYDKGATVMNMLNYTLTKPVFMNNIREYLNNFRYRSASAQDFYKHMLTSSELALFNNWIEKPGFPYLNITERLSADPNSIILNIEQHIFNNEDNNLRVISLNIVSTDPNYKPNSILLNEKSISITVPRNYAYKIHTGLLSYYSIKYPFTNIQLFKDFELTSQDIVKLISDSISFIDSGLVSNEYILPIFNLLSRIKDISSWNMVLKLTKKYFDDWSHFPSVDSALSLLNQNMYNFILKTTGLTLKQNPGLELDLQFAAFTQLAHFGNNSIINQATGEFNKTISNLNKFDFLFEKLIFQTVLSSSDPYYYQAIIKVIDESAGLNNLLMTFLPHTNPQHLPTVLKWLLKNHFYSNEFNLFIYNLPNYSITNRIAWTFITENWNHFKELYTNEETLMRLIQVVISKFFSPEDIQIVNDFLIIKLSPESFRRNKLEDKSLKFLQDEPGMLKTLPEMTFEV